MFLARTIMQPLLLIFVFTYVFPKIGQGIGRKPVPTSPRCSWAGRSRASMIFQGVQAVALPLVQDFGYTREIEDRVLAPMPVWAVAAEKVAGGAIQALLASLVVFPLALVIPANTVHLSVHWLLPAHAAPAGRGHERGVRAHDRNARATAPGSADLQPARDPDDVPRRGVLPVANAHAPAVAEDRGAREPARST